MAGRSGQGLRGSCRQARKAPFSLGLERNRAPSQRPESRTADPSVGVKMPAPLQNWACVSQTDTPQTSSRPRCLGCPDPQSKSQVAVIQLMTCQSCSGQMRLSRPMSVAEAPLQLFEAHTHIFMENSAGCRRGVNHVPTETSRRKVDAGIKKLLEGLPSTPAFLLPLFIHG